MKKKKSKVWKQEKEQEICKQDLQARLRESRRQIARQRKDKRHSGRHRERRGQIASNRKDKRQEQSTGRTGDK